ncbi:MAG: restriction endonuclease subunit S [Gemmatimonadetes bacterium]|nr:restriction endonuclease subunit S [Gemmatimonadota bacterium]
MFRDRSDRHLTSAKAAELNCTYLQPDDVLVARMPDPLGRACMFPRRLGKFVTVVDVAVIRPGSGSVDPSWLMWSINSPQASSQIDEHQSGTTRKRISRKNLARVKLAVPPLAEQSRIVAAIEEHFSRLDAVESTQRQIIRKIDILKSSLLADAFRMNGDLPPGWQQKTIGEVAQVQLGRQRSPQHHSGPQMRPYLRSANVTWEGISLDDVKQMNFDDADFETYRLEPGDLLLNEASGSPGEVGKPAIWEGEIENCCFQNTLLRIRTAEVYIKYLYWYSFASALSGRFGDAGRGVNIRHLGKRGLSQFPIPIAPREEQGEIAVRLDQQFEQAKRLKQTAQLVLDRVTALRRAVLAQAFSGRLVPQDLNDEPASALLHRIAATRQPA